MGHYLTDNIVKYGIKQKSVIYSILVTKRELTPSRYVLAGPVEEGSRTLTTWDSQLSLILLPDPSFCLTQAKIDIPVNVKKFKST